MEITFSNENNFGIIQDGVKIWSIPETFEFVKTINEGDTFIANCKDSEDSVYIEIFELGKIDISNDSMSFNHYGGLLLNNVECIHPDIIKDSFDINLDEKILPLK